MKRYDLIMAFERDIVDVDLLMTIVQEHLGFSPDELNYRRTAKKKLQDPNFLSDLFVKGEGFQLGRCNGEFGNFVFNKGKYDYLKWATILGVPSDNFIRELVATPGFVAGYAFDYSFVSMQNETFVQNYISFNKPFEHLPTYKGVDGIMYVDITETSGRSFFHIESGFDVRACWKMWLGKEIRGFYPGKPVSEFPDAFELKELDNDIVYVQLYKELSDSETPAAMEAMRRFREWTQMDVISPVKLPAKTMVSEAESAMMLEYLKVHNKPQ